MHDCRLLTCKNLCREYSHALARKLFRHCLFYGHWLLLSRFFEVGVFAGIDLHAFTGLLFDQAMGNILVAHMQDTCAAVVSLLLRSGRPEYTIDQFRCVFTVYRCPTAVVGTILSIDIFIIQMGGPHMVVICDIFWKVCVGPSV